MYYEKLAEEAEKAGNLGKQGVVFQIVKQMTGRRAGAADLKGMDQKKWADYFKGLLGTEGNMEEMPDFIQSKESWRKAHEWIEDKSRYEPEWKVETGPPTEIEIEKAAKACADGKGVNRDEIPAELWKNSKEARLMLFEMLGKVWTDITEEKRRLEIPGDWVDATLVCLYKGKGSRKDASKYRGISLISSIEKMISIIILERIKVHVNGRLMQGQNGFRLKKACRDAVFRLWRELEKSNREKEAFIITFIDYSKAFDSLNWENLWKTLEFAGCPRKLVTVIRKLYENSTISLRLSSDGELAPEIKQKRGIRQGSSLSPCLFVLAMDYCLRVFQSTCVEKGLPSHENTWTAYADDVADKSISEEEATEALQQLEAASAFVGLRLNVAKTEVLARGIRKPEKAKDETPFKERIVLREMEGKKVKSEEMGWMTEVRWSHLMNGEESAIEDEREDMKLLELDNGSSLKVQDRGSGWAREGTKNYRIQKLGFESKLGEEKKKQNRRVKGTDPWKQRVRIKYDDGDFEGWKTELKWAPMLGEEEVQGEGSRLQTFIVFDDGQQIYVEERGRGWIRDKDGDKHRMTNLDEKTRIDSDKCINCGHSFDTDKGRKIHSTRCKRMEDLTIKQMVRLRRTRQDAITRAGKRKQEVEMISVKTCDQREATPCANFKYLGSMIDGTASASLEIRRRIALATTTFGSLNRIWRSNELSWKTKASLYKALILSIMLYNAEVWPITEQQLKSLEGAHYRMQRRMLLRDKEDHISKEQIRQTLGGSSIVEHMAQKRMRWIGHALRRQEGDLSKGTVRRELGNRKSAWTQLVERDCQFFGIPFFKLESMAQDRGNWRAKTAITIGANGAKTAGANGAKTASRDGANFQEIDVAWLHTYSMPSRV